MSIFRSGIFVLLAALAGLAIGHPKVLAQSSPAVQDQAQAPQTQSKPPIAVPNDQLIATLVFSTLIALNQANLTGNYEVFRELGAPGFQAANSAAGLAEVYAPMRRRRLDISPILLLQLQMRDRPEINANGMLRVTGYFPTRPEYVNFDLLYQWVRGQWLLFSIAANLTPPSETDAAASQGVTAEPAKTAAQPQAVPSTESSNGATSKHKPLPDVRDTIHQLESDSNQ